MSMDAGGLAHMTYNSNGNAFPSAGGLGVPGAGFGNRSRLNNKRLSVALPPKVDTISESAVNPTPRTSRSHLLAGLRTQPKTPTVPASAPYHQTEHPAAPGAGGPGASRWGHPSYESGYGEAVPQTASAAGFNISGQYAAPNAGSRQMYSLPEHVLAPPSMYDQTEEMDPAVLQQMQMTSLFLAQRQQQLQQQLASLTMATQGMSLNANVPGNAFQSSLLGQQTPQNLYALQQQQQQQLQQLQQIQSPIEVQPGVFLVYNHATQGYSYAIDQTAQQQASLSPAQQNLPSAFSPPPLYETPTPSVQVSPPGTQRSTPINGRSFTPPRTAPSPPSAADRVDPLPPPSANAFRRGHAPKKSSTLSINPLMKADAGPQTASAATFGSQRSAFPPTPMTGTFGPGAARSGEHPMRQPRGPPPLEELTAAPTSKHEGSKNFVTRERRRALDSLMKAGIGRSGVSRSSGGSPVSEREAPFTISEEGEDGVSVGSAVSRKMSPIGSEMKEKRGSQGSSDGYFGLSSASSSEGEDVGLFKQPLTPATPDAAPGTNRKMMLGLISAAEKRRTYVC